MSDRPSCDDSRPAEPVAEAPWGRRRAGALMLVVLAVGFVARVVGDLFVVGPVSQVASTLGSFLAVLLVQGMLVPLPPGPFAWSPTWPRVELVPGCLDPFLVRIALGMTWFVLGIGGQSSLGEVFGRSVVVQLAVGLGVFLAGAAVLMSTLEVRRRRRGRPDPSPSSGTLAAPH